MRDPNVRNYFAIVSVLPRFPLLYLEDQVFRRRFADIQDLVPFHAGTAKARPRGQVNFPSPAFIRYPHAAARQGIAEMRSMIVAFMSHSRLESASEDSLVRIFVQALTNRRTLPARGQRVGELRGCRACGSQ